MKTISIDKITLNVGVGEPGEQLDKAMKLLQNMSGKKPVKTVTQKRIPTWKIRPGLQIGCKVTLRGKEAEHLLKNLLKAKGNRININKFDKSGNFSFGIHEYLDVPDAKYDADIGIIGFEVSITFKRPGFRVKRRYLRPSKIPARHRITKEESIEFMKKNFKIEVEE